MSVYAKRKEIKNWAKSYIDFFGSITFQTLPNIINYSGVWINWVID